MMAFNYAVWRFRKPAHASRLEESHDWLIRKLVGCANVILHQLKPPERKRKKKFDRNNLDPQTIEHDALTSNIMDNVVICYTDGSASLNPGPCGAAASIFVAACH